MVNNKWFELDVSSISPNSWIHVTMIYRGPNSGEGITVYHDAVEVGSDTVPYTLYTVTSSGMFKIGRKFDPPGDKQYGTMYMDELLFWNRILHQTEIEMVKNMV